MNKKTTEEFIKEVEEQTKDYKVIGEYKGTNEKIEMLCLTCNNHFFMTPNHFLNTHTRCPFCEVSKRLERNKKRALTDSEFREKLKNINNKLEPLEPYKGTKTKILIKCKCCGNEFKAMPNKLLNYRGCPKCANINRVKNRKGKTQQKTTEEIKNKIFELVGNEYELLEDYKGIDTPILFKHNSEICNNRVFKMTPKMFINAGHRCSYCNGSIMTENLFIKRFNEKFINNFSYVSGYINMKRKVKVKHKCGYEFEIKAGYALSKNVPKIMCPKCNKGSYPNFLIREFLSENDIDFKREVAFPKCVYKKSLRFDFQIFYNSDNFFLIEYDGEQHRKHLFGTEEDFKIAQERDKIKDEYCIKNNITLYRLSNIKTLYDDLEEILVHYKLL